MRIAYIQKKRGSLYLLPVPHFEAFALPSLIERATQKPTPICNQPHCALLVYSACSVMIYTYPMGAYRCHVPEQTLKFAKFRSVKNKAPCKRLLYMCPNPPAALQRRRGAGSCKVNIFCNKNRFGLNQIVIRTQINNESPIISRHEQALRASYPFLPASFSPLVLNVARHAFGQA